MLSWMRATVPGPSGPVVRSRTRRRGPSPQSRLPHAGVYRPDPGRHEKGDGLDEVFAVNALAPYLLTALIEGPQRLIYLTSGLHQGGDPDLRDLQWRRRRWSGPQAYANSKLFDGVLAFAVARLLA